MPSLFAFGLEDGRVPTFWLLLYVMAAPKPKAPGESAPSIHLDASSASARRDGR